MKREDVYYEAMLARDHRFDGQFYIGVKTTGIYCRPICPAKPLRKNVEFFQNYLEAEKAGYRPCLRWRPESAPRSAAWIGKTAIVQRALKGLHQKEALEFDEDQFAEKFGVSARHLRRLFVEEVGKTPKQLCFENRLNLSRKLITETSLKIAEVAFAAGFESIRRFNDAFKKRFKKSPSEIRRSPLLANKGLVVSLSYRPPFNYQALYDHYKNHRVGLLENFENGIYQRWVECKGLIGQIKVTNIESSSRLEVEIDFPDSTQIHHILSRVRVMFDLDSDPLIIANTLESNQKIKYILKKHPGIRIASGWDSFEAGIITILGQLVSVEAGRNLVASLVEICGTKTDILIDGKPLTLFPTVMQILNANLDNLKPTQVRKRTLKNFAQAILDQSIQLDSTQDVDLFLESLLKISGIGPWSAQYMAMKCLRHTDAFPATDLILSRALEMHSKSTIESMRPWRAYVASLLWREYATQLKKNRGVQIGQVKK